MGTIAQGEPPENNETCYCRPMSLAQVGMSMLVILFKCSAAVFLTRLVLLR